MPRGRSPNRDKAKTLWLESKGLRELKDIAAELDVSDVQIRKWKNLDCWDSELISNVTNQNKESKGNVAKNKKVRGVATEKKLPI